MKNASRSVVKQAGQAAAWSCKLLTPRLRHAKAGPLGAGNAVRRRVRRIVGFGIGLLRHDGEVENVVMEGDAVLVLSGPVWKEDWDYRLIGLFLSLHLEEVTEER